jgi:hypothetical protein
MMSTFRKLFLLWSLLMSSLAFGQGYPPALIDMIDRVYLQQDPSNPAQVFFAVSWKSLNDSTPAAKEAQASLSAAMLKSLTDPGMRLLFWGNVTRKSGPNSELLLEGVLNQQTVSAGGQDGVDYSFELRRVLKNRNAMNYDYPKIFFQERPKQQFGQFWISSVPTKLATKYYELTKLTSTLPEKKFVSKYNRLQKSNESYLKEHAGHVVPAFFPAQEGQVIGRYDLASGAWVEALKQGLVNGSVTLKMLHDFGNEEVLHPILSGR